jgi:hypothetical protein
MDFENGIAEQTITVADDAADERGKADSESAVFTSDLESGDFSSWSSHS